MEKMAITFSQLTQHCYQNNKLINRLTLKEYSNLKNRKLESHNKIVLQK